MEKKGKLCGVLIVVFMSSAFLGCVTDHLLSARSKEEQRDYGGAITSYSHAYFTTGQLNTDEFAASLERIMASTGQTNLRNTIPLKTLRDGWVAYSNYGYHREVFIFSMVLNTEPEPGDWKTFIEKVENYAVPIVHNAIQYSYNQFEEHEYYNSIFNEYNRAGYESFTAGARHSALAFDLLKNTIVGGSAYNDRYAAMSRYFYQIIEAAEGNIEAALRNVPRM